MERLLDLYEWYLQKEIARDKKTTIIPQTLAIWRALKDKDTRTLFIILDAARYEVSGMVVNALQKHGVVDAHPVRMAYSPASNTFDWVRRTFPRKYLNVTYISGATPINDVAYDWSEHKDLLELYAGYRPKEHIGHIVNAWDTCWNPDVGTVDPQCLTERAKEVIAIEQNLLALQESHERRPNVVFVHYFQPHMPPTEGAYFPQAYLPPKVRKRRGHPPADPPDARFWELVKSGKISPEEVAYAYYSNARVAIHKGVLPLVMFVIKKQLFDRIVITADHGNMLGEDGIWGHPPEVRRERYAQLRLVPWIEIPMYERTTDVPIAKDDPLGIREDISW